MRASLHSSRRSPPRHGAEPHTERRVHAVHRETRIAEAANRMKLTRSIPHPFIALAHAAINQLRKVSKLSVPMSMRMVIVILVLWPCAAQADLRFVEATYHV